MKASSPSGADGGDSRLQVLWEDGERIFCKMPRDGADGERYAFMPAYSATAYPTPESLDRLTHEYALRDCLDSDWALRPLELVRERGRTMLLVEYPGGEPLDRLLGRPMDVSIFLRVAVSLASALHKTHGRGLIHKDLRPANILVDMSSATVRLTGFGISSRLPREHQISEPPEVIAGTLAYMAPEQTGRMNRSVDSRSDLYALGITFYEMLTGVLPFVASDPMEWVHCHIARQPVAPDQHVKEIPLPLSAIVLKLLAKAAEDRYQTAAGVASDLLRCYREWDARRSIDAFPLGTQDISDRLLIPEKLYGREREIDILLAAFDRVVTNGTKELALVSGYSGIGKSSVVNELHKVLVAPRGLFASGKFDQYKRDIPYATLAQAFQSLVRPLLGQSEAQLGRWRDTLRDALGPNGQLMVNLVPELELVIGAQPPVVDLPPQDAKNRFQMVFRRFLGVFACKEHPLALFLDDLQWLDSATLELLEHLVTQPEVRYLLLVGAYRDNEVGPAHPLTRTLETIREAGVKVNDILLAPLRLHDVGELIADALHSEPQRTQSLAALMHEKTNGNPFFAIQFVTALVEEGLLVFDPVTPGWRWDIERIQARSYTDNVVDLMAAKLKRLSSTTQDAMKQLACLGNAANIATLATVHGQTAESIRAALWEAVHAGLVVYQDNAYIFLHDRIQQAAYSLIPESHRGEVHLALGRVLLASLTADELAEHVFDVANQLNRGVALLVDRDEKAQVATINLRAGRKAKASAAHASACVYLTAGMTLLDESDWNEQYELTFNLWLERAECEFLTGNFDRAEQLIRELLRRAASKIDQASVHHLEVQLHVLRSENPQAVTSALTCLQAFGIDFAARPTWEQVQVEYETVWRSLEGRPIESLIGLPLMSNREMRAAMGMLSALLPSAYFTNFHLYCLLVCRMVNVSMQHGTTGASAHAYGRLGTVLGPAFQRYRDGYRFAKLACDLVEKHDFVAYRAKVHHAMAWVACWTQPVTTAIDFNRSAFRAASETGDLTYACYSMFQSFTGLLLRNDPLDAVWRETEKGVDFARKARFRDLTDNMVSQQRFIATMLGRTRTFSTFSDAQFDEAAFEAQLTPDRSLTVVCWYWILKLKARFMAGDYAEALSAGEKAKAFLWASRAHVQLLDYFYYTALAVAANYEKGSAEQQVQWRDLLTAHGEQLREWADNYPPTFADKHLLVSAEIARVEERTDDAMRLYEQAIQAARENGFVQNEGLAYEVAARFYAARDLETIAHAYLRNARHCYLRWGALGKVRQLDQRYPWLGDASAPSLLTATIGASVQLDIGAVVTASQAVSGEIVLSRLIETLMKLALEHAGAERGLLILLQGDALRIEAEARTDQRNVEVTLRREAVTATELPESLLHTVIRTQTSVILDDASAHNAFSGDEYIRRSHPRSVLCLPLMKQAKLVGMLYLENNLASHVFTPARMSVLRLLSSQAAISLENARLYADLAAENIQRRRTDDALRSEVLERQRAEQLARMDEMRFRRFFDLPLIGMAVTSPQRRFVEVNQKLCEIVGYPREELVGRDWVSITHPDDVSGNINLLDEAIAGTTESYSMDKRYIHRDGQIIYVSISACCVRRPDGTPDHFVLTVQDVTPRYQVQEKLHLTEAHLKHAQQVAQIASYEAYPPEFFSTAWSQQLCDIFGVQPGTVVSSREEYIERFVHADDRDYMRNAFQGRGKADRRSMLEYRIVRPDGTVRHLQTIADPVKDESGRIAHLVGTILDVTERKLATERLETQTALLDQLFLSVAEATVLLDLDDRVLRVNTEFTRMFGYRAEQAIGVPINDLIVPAERTGEAAQLSSNLAAGQMCNAESVRRRQDGTRLQVSILGAPIMSGGRQIASYAIYRDITERKRVEEAQGRHARHVALRADVHAAFSRAGDALSEVLRRGAEAIVQNLHGALVRIWTLDQKSVLELRASAGLYTHLDGPYSRIPLGDLIVGKIAQDRAPHLTHDLLNDVRIGDRDWVQKEGIVSFVGVPLMIEGRVAGVVAMFARRPLESDTVEAFEAIADTIAQGIGRRRAEEALRESEQRFRDYAEAASDWLWETGPDHRFIWFSLRNAGVHQPDNRIGKTRWEITAEAGEQPEKWREHIAALDAHEPFRGFTYRTVQADGSIAYLAVSGKPVFDAQGGFQGYRGVASDVTAAVRAEQTEKALHQAQAELAHVARVTSLGALTASIAHEVNQPLTGIINNAGTCLRMLAADPPNIDGARETTRRTLRDGNRASEVIARLRTLFSKKGAVMDAVDLNEATREVIAMSSSELQRDRLVAQLELADDLPPVAGDRVQLQQVILNLLLNAADAMSDVEDRARRVLIRTERDEGDRVRLSVQDVGVGLDPQSMNRLFEAFYTTKTNGMGIGLSVSRSIIERHQGRLWATANEGPGATFSFSVPCSAG